MRGASLFELYHKFKVFRTVECDGMSNMCFFFKCCLAGKRLLVQSTVLDLTSKCDPHHKTCPYNMFTLFSN